VDGGVAEYTKRGMYSNVQTGARTPFVVVPPPTRPPEDGKTPMPPFDPMPKEEPVAQPSAETAGDPMLQALAESMAARNSHGLRETIGLDHDGTPTRSIAFAFYRHLHLFKMRISVPAKDMSQEDFERLVPRVEVQNFGTCGNATISLPPESKKRLSKAEKEKNASAGAAELIREMGRISRDNCASSPGQASTAANDVERVVVSYPEGTWQ
jgi:hypothetical protein